MTDPPAVILSGHLMALGVVRCLGRRDVGSVVVHYRPETDIAQTSRYVLGAIRTGHPEHDQVSFLETLRRLGPRFEGSPLIPASDESLAVVARHRSELERWYRVACPDESVVRAVIEKEHTYALADDIGVLAPRTFQPTSEADLEPMARDLGYPCLVKPSQSHRYFEVFGRKMVRADDPDGLKRAYLEARQADVDVLLQELIPGDDTHGINYNSYRIGRRVVAEFTARKWRLTPRNFGPPSVVESRRVPEVLEAGRRILDALDLEGYSCVEFKRDARDGRYRLMEVNARFNLSVLLSERCGLNFPHIMYRHLIRDEVDVEDRFREGVFWIDGTKDLVYGVPELLRHPTRLPSLIRPYLRERVFAVADANDMRPFAKRLSLLVTSSRERALRTRR